MATCQAVSAQLPPTVHNSIFSRSQVFQKKVEPNFALNNPSICHKKKYINLSGQVLTQQII
jgi:hypothetical protein